MILDNHKPIMTNEILSFINNKKNLSILDCTFGGGGHSKKFLENGHSVTAIDQDENSLTIAQELKKKFSNICFYKINFKDLDLLSLDIKKFNFISWNDAIKQLHKPENIGKYNSNFYKRLAYDEILASFLVHSEIRRKIKKIKKEKKVFNLKYQNSILDKLDFDLTYDQEKTLKEINNDLRSNQKMFRYYREM